MLNSEQSSNTITVTSAPITVSNQNRYPVPVIYQFELTCDIFTFFLLAQEVRTVDALLLSSPAESDRETPPNGKAGRPRLDDPPAAFLMVRNPWPREVGRLGHPVDPVQDLLQGSSSGFALSRETGHLLSLGQGARATGGSFDRFSNGGTAWLQSGRNLFLHSFDAASD